VVDFVGAAGQHAVAPRQEPQLRLRRIIAIQDRGIPAIEVRTGFDLLHPGEVLPPKEIADLREDARHASEYGRQAFAHLRPKPKD